jgi:hypothetical protein
MMETIPDQLNLVGIILPPLCFESDISLITDVLEILCYVQMSQSFQGAKNTYNFYPHGLLQAINVALLVAT